VDEFVVAVDDALAELGEAVFALNGSSPHEVKLRERIRK